MPFFYLKSPYNVIHFLVLGITFAFVIQGIYSSCYYMDYYYYSYDSWYTLRSSDAANCILIALGFLCTATLSVAAYTFQEFDKLKLKSMSIYLSFRGILVCFNSSHPDVFNLHFLPNPDPANLFDSPGSHSLRYLYGLPIDQSE